MQTLDSIPLLTVAVVAAILEHQHQQPLHLQINLEKTDLYFFYRKVEIASKLIYKKESYHYDNYLLMSD